MAFGLCQVIIYVGVIIIRFFQLADIMHRDLKLENILVKNSLDDYNGKLDIKVRLQLF